MKKVVLKSCEDGIKSSQVRKKQQQQPRKSGLEFLRKKPSSCSVGFLFFFLGTKTKRIQKDHLFEEAFFFMMRTASERIEGDVAKCGP